MTYFGPHERAVVQGDNQCTCGRDWPCGFSAEGKLAALRDYLTTMAAAMDEARDVAAEKPGGTRLAAGYGAEADAYRKALAKIYELDRAVLRTRRHRGGVTR